jgi:hypothetical protein
MRSAGISLREALRQTDYADVRASFGPAELLPLLRENPDLVDQWIMYSQDKRTSGGWYLGESKCEVGRLDTGESFCFTALDEAVAQYVVRELDFWSEVGRHSTSR